MEDFKSFTKPLMLSFSTLVLVVFEIDATQADAVESRREKQMDYTTTWFAQPRSIGA